MKKKTFRQKPTYNRQKTLKFTYDPLFNTQEWKLAELWDVVQRHQVDFVFPLELSYYYTWHGCRNAYSVIDLGCGNGYYLDRLVSCFPNKIYYGIDKSLELIGMAKQRYSGQNIAFRCHDIYELEDESKCDFIIMRLLMQHMADPRALIKKAANIAAPGASAVVIDSIDAYRFLEPDVPRFREFFVAYAERQRERGFDRDVASQLSVVLAECPEWRIKRDRELVIPSTLPGNLDRFRAIYGLFIDIAERSRILEWDFEAVRRDWQEWCCTEDAFAQVGAKFVMLERV